MKLRRIDRYRVGLLNEAGMLTSESRDSYRLEHPADLGLIESMWSAIQPEKWDKKITPQTPEQWQRAFFKLIDHKFDKDRDLFLDWLDRASETLHIKAISSDVRESATVAHRSLEAEQATADASGRSHRKLERCFRLLTDCR